MIVQDDEIPDLLVFQPQQPVVFVALGTGETGIGEQAQQARDARLHQMDAGRLQRFQKAAREPQRDAIALP